MIGKGTTPGLLDIKQAARFLQVSETSLRRWTNSGVLSSLRVGRRRERRFRREDLVAFMEHHPVGGDGRKHRGRGNGHTVVGGMVISVGTHLCGLYDSDEGRTAQAAAFLADGLRPGGACVLIAAAKAREQILARLQVGSSSLIQADIDSGHLVLGDYSATAQAQWDYFEAALLAASRSGATAVRLVGDVTSGRFGKSLERIVEYETGYHRLIARRFPVVTLCQYDARHYSGRDILAVYRCHGDNFSIPAERLLA